MHQNILKGCPDAHPAVCELKSYSCAVAPRAQLLRTAGTPGPTTGQCDRAEPNKEKPQHPRDTPTLMNDHLAGIQSASEGAEPRTDLALGGRPATSAVYQPIYFLRKTADGFILTEPSVYDKKCVKVSLDDL
ncbi:hypothetical protein F2P79_005082 [Pimephales promelas]|nr:hypothetical protein F2P79_005082 [Pimephales promelas]